MTTRIDITCPPPLDDRRSETIQLAHGGGGTRMHDLIERVFAPAFDNPFLNTTHDAAVLSLPGARIAVTTDSFVVHPVFFPGGDIGSLAVYGTVNDLAMSGAVPHSITAGFIIEEGFSLSDLERIADSMRVAADRARVAIVTGDTKVVDKGKGDGVFINTTGVGVLTDGVDIQPARVREGDAVLVSGDLGRHGVAILSQREGLAFESPLTSDCAPLASVVAAMLDACPTIHCLRDLTRGGLTSAVNEIARSAGVGITLIADRIPVNDAVRGACELLGLDPLSVANEGRLAAFVPEDACESVLRAMRAHPDGAGAACIGHVTDDAGRVTLMLPTGAARVLDMLSGEQLPRIC